jgi:hypothetical protein
LRIGLRLSGYLAVGRGFEGELAIRRGDAQNGVHILQSSLEALRSAPYELLTTPLNIALIQGLAAMNKAAEAIELADATIRHVEVSGDFVYLPELFRVKGHLLLSCARYTLHCRELERNALTSRDSHHSIPLSS